MIEMESKTVDKFFDMKMVDNAASKAIEKIKWSLEEEKTSIVLQSQLFEASCSFQSFMHG